MGSIDSHLTAALSLGRRDRIRLIRALERSLQDDTDPLAVDLKRAGDDLEQSVGDDVRAGRLADALAQVEQHLARLSSTDGKSAADLHVLRGAVLVRMGKSDRAEAAYREAYRLGVASECARRQAIALWGLARVASLSARRDEEIHRCEEAAALFATLNDEEREARTRLQQAFALHERGDLDAADAAYARALQVATKRTMAREEALVHLYSGWLLIERREGDAGRARLELACALLDALGEQRYVAAGFYCQAIHRLIEGAYPETRNALDLGFAAAAGLEDRTVYGLLSAAEGAWAALAGDSRAQTSFDAARRAFEASGDTTSLRVEAARVLEGTLGAAEGRFELARARLAAAREAYGDRPFSSDLRMAMQLLDGVLGETDPALVIGPEARWFAPPGRGRVSIARRGALRRILLRLAAEPSSVCAPEGLIHSGWPDDRADPESARRRLRTAIWTLRRLGLEGLLETTPDGYRLRDGLNLRSEL